MPTENLSQEAQLSQGTKRRRNGEHKMITQTQHMKTQTHKQRRTAQKNSLGMKSCSPSQIVFLLAFLRRHLCCSAPSFFVFFFVFFFFLLSVIGAAPFHLIIPCSLSLLLLMVMSSRSVYLTTLFLSRLSPLSS